MKYIRKALLFLIIASVFVLIPAFTSNAENEKKELVYINFSTFFKKGIVVKRDDEESWKEFAQKRKLFLENISAATEDYSGSARLVVDTFDTTEVYIDAPGTYFIIVKLAVASEYADEYYISDENSSFIIPVGIADPDELRLFRIYDGASMVEYSWYSEDVNLPMEIQYLEAPEGFFYSEDELMTADWKVCDDETLATSTPLSLRITRPLPEGTDYYYRMVVGNRISNMIRISNCADYEYDGDSCVGTRDGDDHNDDADSELIQSAPSASIADKPSENTDSAAKKNDKKTTTSSAPAQNSKETTVDEIVTKTKTTLSGVRIKILLCQSGENLSFAWDGICLRIPKTYFEQLNLPDDSLFSVEMIRSDNTSFSLSIEIDGQKLNEFNTSSIQFMTDTKDPMKFLFLNGQALDSKVSCDNGYYSFTVTRPGTYTLSAGEDSITDSTTDNTPASDIYLSKIIVPVSAALFAALILYVYFKKKGWRKE